MGTPGPKIIGIDELSIRKRHTYRIVISDLLRERAIWFGGTDQKEKSLDEFYRFLWEKKAKRIVIDMRASVLRALVVELTARTLSIVQ